MSQDGLNAEGVKCTGPCTANTMSLQEAIGTLHASQVVKGFHEMIKIWFYLAHHAHGFTLQLSEHNLACSCQVKVTELHC